MGRLATPGGQKNWIEGLSPATREAWHRSWIYRAAVHMHEDKGMPVGRAIATAVNAAKWGCATGDLNFKGPQSVNPRSRAEMCAAVALWNKMRGENNG